MEGKRKYLQNHLIKSIKIALAALLAIFLAGELGLRSSATAGIITILSIQNTKKETVRTVLRRGAAYASALFIAAICFKLLGYTLVAFAVYLLIFAFFCMVVGLQEGITTAAVLISHFLNAGNMRLPMVINETGLFIIGSGIGIMVNLHLRRRDADFERLAQVVDDQIRDTLRRMAEWLPDPNRACDRVHRFGELEEAIQQAKLCAVANMNNSFFSRGSYELDYIKMREQQAVVLKGIYANIMQIGFLPAQAKKVADYLTELEQAYHKYNTVTEYLDKLEKLGEEMRQEELPKSREEFEARAILFYVLMQLEELLWIKRRFVVTYEDRYREYARNKA